MGQTDLVGVTRLLEKWNRGESSALSELIPTVYEDLRRLARQQIRRELPDQRIQATDLVHQAYLKFAVQRSVSWRDRAHFFGAAAIIMRRILVDEARRRLAIKHGGGMQAVTLDTGLLIPGRGEVDLLAVNQALIDLEGIDARQAQIVEMRVFGGLSVEEISSLLEISESTVKREWRFAKAWLSRELSRQA
ncbi:MAG: sigma-70 family RNA polymerase sigma factor [Acidobacteria bacterium]|nr:sigma-70 family RNA polymerase sigma factor [Acidobacteriota bacterium]